jgi:hypothetical protein
MIPKINFSKEKNQKQKREVCMNLIGFILSSQCKISPKEKTLYLVGRKFDTIVDEWFRHRSNYILFSIYIYKFFNYQV